MENRILGTDNKKPLQPYERIVSINTRKKEPDIIHHFTRFCEKQFRFYLTTHQNDFELVIIDETDVFICFYKEEKVVASALHVQGKSIAKEFIELFNNFKKRDIIEEFNCEHIKKSSIQSKLREVKRIFREYCTP